MFASVSVADVAAPQVIVYGVFKDLPPEGMLRKSPHAGLVASAAAREECKGEAGKLAEAFDAGARIIVVGLGKQSSFKPGDVRGAMASVGRRLASIKAERVKLVLAPALDAAGADLAHAGRCAGEALGFLSWDATQFKGTLVKGEDKPKRMKLQIDADKSAIKKGLAKGLELALCGNLTRTLSETPPNVATPEFMAGAAAKLAKECGLKITVLRGKDLEKEKLAGHINVGQASENKPCFIRLEYTPDKQPKKPKKPAVLVGKTMTYDTGGLSLKVNNGMVGMKRDKDGGCAVLGAMRAVASVIKPSRPVVAYLCAAENSVSDNAYRPDDIITYRNGVSVEITNTDAEGRLVLADALCYSCDKDDPAYIVELSTLTGGVVVALGSTFAGMFCDDDALRGRVERASELAGERVWRLPNHSEYRDMMKSPVADILNSNPNRKAHASQGAAFLGYFVKDGVPFCHLDIAGVHVCESDSGMFVKGNNSFGVRLLADLLDQE